MMSEASSGGSRAGKRVREGDREREKEGKEARKKSIHPASLEKGQLALIQGHFVSQACELIM